MPHVKTLALCLLVALPISLASWGERVESWLGGIRELLQQVQEGDACAPCFSSEKEALEYVDARMEALCPRVELSLRQGMSPAFSRKVADLFMYRGYSNSISYTISGDRLTVSPVYTDWVVMRAVYLGQLREKALSEEMRRAYRRALAIVKSEREKLAALPGGQADDAYALALALHDYLCRHATYTLRKREPVSTATSRLLLEGQGVCEGYARAYSLLLTMAGIDNRYIFGCSGGEAHAWNLVKLRGRWLHVDVTMDDVGRPGRRYFAISAGQMARDHHWEHRWWPDAS